MNPETSNIQHPMKEQKTENDPLISLRSEATARQAPSLSPEGEREKRSQKLHRVQGFNARNFSRNSLPSHPMGAERGPAFAPTSAEATAGRRKLRPGRQPAGRQGCLTPRH